MPPQSGQGSAVSGQTVAPAAGTGGAVLKVELGVAVVAVGFPEQAAEAERELAEAAGH